MLELKDVTYSYQNKSEAILSKVNYRFEKGKFYSIIGQSGAGKSTLLSLLAGLDYPKKGQVLFNGENIKKKGSSYHRRHHVALVFQNYNLIDYLTPLENVRLVNKNADRKILSELGLDKKQINRNVLQLSGGQQQRVALARTLAQKPEIILADEPVAALDPITATQVMDDFKKINKELNMSVLINIHHVDLALKYADRVIGIKAGEIVYDGAAKDVTNEVLKQIYGRELAADEVMGA